MTHEQKKWKIRFEEKHAQTTNYEVYDLVAS